MNIQIVPNISIARASTTIASNMPTPPTPPQLKMPSPAVVTGTRTLQQTREEMALRATVDQARQYLSPGEVADLDWTIRQHPGLSSISDELKIVQSLLQTDNPQAALRSYLQLRPFRVENPDRLDPGLAQAIAYNAGNFYVSYGSPLPTQAIASLLATTDHGTYINLRDAVMLGPRGTQPPSKEQQKNAILLIKYAMNEHELLSSDPDTRLKAAQSIYQWIFDHYIDVAP
jgi:hypothetical protein